MSTTTITVPASASPTSSSSSKHKSVAGPIAGGVVGGLAFIAIVGGAVWFFLRRRAGGKPEGMYDLTEGRRGATPQEISEDEVFVFPGVCSSCSKRVETKMKRVNIPYFKASSCCSAR